MSPRLSLTQSMASLTLSKTSLRDSSIFLASTGTVAIEISFLERAGRKSRGDPEVSLEFGDVGGEEAAVAAQADIAVGVPVAQNELRLQQFRSPGRGRDPAHGHGPGSEEAAHDEGRPTGFPCEDVGLGAGRDPAGHRAGPHLDDPDLFTPNERDSPAVRGPYRERVRHVPLREAPRLTHGLSGSNRKDPDLLVA